MYFCYDISRFAKQWFSRFLIQQKVLLVCKIYLSVFIFPLIISHLKGCKIKKKVPEYAMASGAGDGHLEGSVPALHNANTFWVIGRHSLVLDCEDFALLPPKGGSKLHATI